MTELIHGRKTFLPKLPVDIEDKEALRDFLQRLVDEIESIYTKLVDNDAAVVTGVDTVEDELDDYVLAPSSTTENKVPQWDSTSKKLKDGTAIGTGNSELVQRTASGHIEFNQKQGLQFVLENRTSDPASPVTGQMWIRTDL